MCKCPTCESSSRKRLTRSFILKLVPKAKFYKCHRCKTKFLSIPYLFSSIILKKGTRKILNENELITN